MRSILYFYNELLMLDFVSAGAVAASMLGFILPGVLYFATFSAEFQDSVNLALFIYSTNNGTILNDEDDEYLITNSSPNKPSVRRFFGSLYKIGTIFVPYYLPVVMILFGVAALFIGVSTILWEYAR